MLYLITKIQQNFRIWQTDDLIILMQEAVFLPSLNFAPAKVYVFADDFHLRYPLTNKQNLISAQALVKLMEEQCQIICL